MTPSPGASSVPGRLADWVARTPDAPAVAEGATTWSIATLLRRASGCATALRALGVTRGARVAWWGAPSLDFTVALLATWRVGATYLGIDPRYTAAEVTATLARAGAGVVLTGAAFDPGEERRAAVRAVASLHDIASLDGASRDGAAEWEMAPDGGDAPETPALLVFTTGSTGTPKGALISHRAIAAASHHQAVATASTARATIHALPCNHIGGLVNVTTAGWWGEQCLVCVPRFSPAAIAAELRARTAVRLPGVPSLFRRCLDDADFRTAAPGRLVHALSGGAPMTPDVHEGLTALGVPVQGMYGQTEMSGSVCFTAFPADLAAACGGVGRAHPGIALRVGPPLGSLDASVGGELQVQGAQLFDGYLDDAQATAEAFTPDGWLRSGDLACVLPDGTVQLTGRLREVINTSGYKVMPGEVERVLLAHPDVALAAVVGRPHPVYGEVPCAFVRWRDGGECEVSTLHAWCAERLASYKRPREIRSLDAFPLLGVGKVDRRALAQLAAEEGDG